MKKIDLVKKLAAAAGVKEDLQIQFFEFFVAKLAEKLTPGDNITIPEIGEFYIKKGAIKNEEMDDIDFDNPLDIMAYPVASGDHVIFMVTQVSPAQLNSVNDIFSEQFNPVKALGVNGNESMSELLDKIISNSRYHKNLIVGQEYLVIGLKELQVLDAGYFDEIFSAAKDKPDLEDFHENLDDALDSQPEETEKPVTSIIEESEVADKILDEFDYDFDDSEFEKVDPFNSAVNNIFPVDSEFEEDVDKLLNKGNNPIDSDEFIRITDKPNFTPGFNQEPSPEVETLESLEVLEEPELVIDEPEIEPSPYEETINNNDTDKDDELTDSEQEYRTEYKKRRKNATFIIVVGFLILVLLGLLAFYKFGGKLFTKTAEKNVTVKPTTTTIERKYDIPVTYSDEKQAQAGTQNSEKKAAVVENSANSEKNTPVVNKSGIEKKENIKEIKQEKLPVDVKKQVPVKKEIPKKEPVKKEIITKESKLKDKSKLEPKKDITKEVSKNKPAAVVKQVSSWKTREQAEAQAKKYRSKGYNATVKAVDLAEKGTWYRVIVSFKSLQQSNSFKE